MNIYLKCDKNYLSIRILQSESKTKLKSKDKIDISVKAIGTILEDNCKHNLEDPKVIDEIEKKAEKELKKLAKKGIEVAKKYETDIFGFGNLLYKKDPDSYKKFDDWDKDGFTKLDVNIKTNIELKFKGSAKQALKEAIDEN